MLQFNNIKNINEESEIFFSSFSLKLLRLEALNDEKIITITISQWFFCLFYIHAYLFTFNIFSKQKYLEWKETVYEIFNIRF